MLHARSQLGQKRKEAEVCDEDVGGSSTWLVWTDEVCIDQSPGV